MHIDEEVRSPTMVYAAFQKGVYALLNKKTSPYANTSDRSSEAHRGGVTHMPIKMYERVSHERSGSFDLPGSCWKEIRSFTMTMCTYKPLSDELVPIYQNAGVLPNEVAINLTIHHSKFIDASAMAKPSGTKPIATHHPIFCYLTLEDYDFAKSFDTDTLCSIYGAPGQCGAPEKSPWAPHLSIFIYPKGEASIPAQTRFGALNLGPSLPRTIYDCDYKPLEGLRHPSVTYPQDSMELVTAYFVERSVNFRNCRASGYPTKTGMGNDKRPECKQLAAGMDNLCRHIDHCIGWLKHGASSAHQPSATDRGHDLRNAPDSGARYCSEFSIFFSYLHSSCNAPPSELRLPLDQFRYRFFYTSDHVEGLLRSVLLENLHLRGTSAPTLEEVASALERQGMSSWDDITWPARECWSNSDEWKGFFRAVAGCIEQDGDVAYMYEYRWFWDDCGWDSDNIIEEIPLYATVSYHPEVLDT